MIRKTASVAAIRKARGVLKRKPGVNSFAEEWAAHKREEWELEEKNFSRVKNSMDK